MLTRFLAPVEAELEEAVIIVPVVKESASIPIALVVVPTVFISIPVPFAFWSINTAL